MFTASRSAFPRLAGQTRYQSKGARLEASRIIAVTIVLAVVAILLPAVLESQQSGAVGPPAGCRLSKAFEPSFSADSQRVAFSANDNQTAPATRKIFVANINGTSRSGISSQSAGVDPTGNRDPVFSPDGASVAWDGFDAIKRRVFVSDATGANRVDASSAEAPNAGTNRHPRWSPDSDRIVWFGNDSDNVAQIFVSDADGANKTLISTVGGGSDPIQNSRPVFNHNGTRVAWSGMTTTGLTGSVSTVAASTAVTGVGTLFTTELLVGDYLVVNGTQRVIASISSDTALTVTAVSGTAPDDVFGTGTDATPDRRRREIYVADDTGANRSVISSAAGILTNNNYPEFDDDGNRIAWSARTGGTNHIYVANAADGLSRVEVSSVGGNDPTGNIRPRFSPNGAKLVWVGNNGAFNSIFTADVNGANRVDITVTPANDPSGNANPVWSPNGAKIAWSGTATHGVQIWVANSNGTAQVEVSIVDDPALCEPPTTTTTSTLPNGGTTTTTSLPSGQPDCPTAATPFTDVSATSFAANDIKCIYGLGITTGTSATTYSPSANVTREQMAAFLGRLWRTAGGSCPTNATPFTDVPRSSFAVDEVKCIYGLGITTGTSPTKYSPQNDVTREQMAAFLARIWRAAGGTCSNAPAPFTDVSATSFARSDINCIYNLLITTGTSATTYSPGANVTREQMAAFLGRLYRGLGELSS